MSFQIEESRVQYTDTKDGTMCEGFLCLPKLCAQQQGRALLPSVLVFHHFAGIDDFTEAKCRDLAKLGYVAFAADVYGKGVRFEHIQECRPTLTKYMENRPTLLRGRLLATLNQLKSFEYVDQHKIAAIGFCFGGLCALDLARINAAGLRVAVSFHGTLKTLPAEEEAAAGGELSKPIQASVLICHGDADLHIGADQRGNCIEELRARKADWQFISYGNAGHSFTWKKADELKIDGVGYNEAADHRSWATMLALLNEKLNL